MKINKDIIIENIKTIFYALIIAIIIRSLFIQPFYIPSSSMEPTMLVGDRLFVTKYSYGYSKHSFPFSPAIFKGRLLSNKPKRGDVVVFKTTRDNRTDFIKRLIGLPGDSIQFINGDLYINNNQVLKNRISSNDIIYCSGSADANNLGHIEVFTYNEKLPNQKTHKTVYKKYGNFKNSNIFIVPKKHYFFLGDNRDCSGDSRYLAGLGYVPEENLVGKAQFIFFSSDFRIGSIFSFWKWHKTIRFDRFFKRIN
jgi:signal peptidase I